VRKSFILKIIVSLFVLLYLSRGHSKENSNEGFTALDLATFAVTLSVPGSRTLLSIGNLVSGSRVVRIMKPDGKTMNPTPVISFHVNVPEINRELNYTYNPKTKKWKVEKEAIEMDFMDFDEPYEEAEISSDILCKQDSVNKGSLSSREKRELKEFNDILPKDEIDDTPFVDKDKIGSDYQFSQALLTLPCQMEDNYGQFLNAFHHTLDKSQTISGFARREYDEFIDKASNTFSSDSKGSSSESDVGSK
jgi:hypothetical protein